MTRNEVYRDIEDTFGFVPSFLKMIPESTIEFEWQLFKKIGLEEGPISNKQRELIGIGISAVSKCKYCTYFHTELAKLFGATDEEIEFAVHYAKHTAGWSAYLNGMALEFEEFKTEISKAVEFVTKMQAKRETAEPVA